MGCNTRLLAGCCVKACEGAGMRRMFPLFGIENIASRREQ